jgi:alpha-beta hydrolase superfamily lysophospholipase
MEGARRNNMRIRKSIDKAAFATLVAASFLNFASATEAANSKYSSATKGKLASSEPIRDLDEGAKQVRQPAAAPIAAPLLAWQPENNEKPRLAMLCIHGFSMHKGTYAPFGKEMAKNGIATYALDMRGFGERQKIDGKSELDFDGSLADIKEALERIHKKDPNVPVVIIGESMGGAIALRATALFPELVAGLISSVPARDRFGLEGEGGTKMKAGLQIMLGGANKAMTDSAMAAVNQMSTKEEVRNVWRNDPLMRTSFSPKEFMQFDNFMAGNLEAAALVKEKPVLFVQGSNDKLVRPAGTWKLFERLGTPVRQMVLSKNSEHLIFEEGQFNPEDIKFVLTWLDRNIAPLNPSVADIKKELPVVASKDEYDGARNFAGVGAVGGATGGVNSAAGKTGNDAIGAASLPAPPAMTEFKNRIATSVRPKISYWIELNRGGKIFRCNNQTEFKTGDAIRFHLIPESEGYAYLVMKASTTGKSDLLFPNKNFGMDNHLKPGKDYAIPAEGWMQFDSNPGTEKLGLVFGQEKFDVTQEMIKSGNLTCLNVPPSQEGKKELCVTRMKLSWDDPSPVMLPDDFSPLSQVATPSGSSLVRLTSTSGEMVSASIQLFHGK